MKLINKWTDIRRNLITLDGYRAAQDKESRDYFQATIRRGHCFVHCTVAGREMFGPSRFVGYLRNSRFKHDANVDKDGSVTNHRIESLLGLPFRISSPAEKAFARFCKLYGIDPEERPRRFIQYNEDINPDDADLIVEDCNAINKDSDLSSTEKKRLTRARIGQGDFRQRLLHYWRRCPVTGCGIQGLLKASHIKPWRYSTNAERLDPYNGLLLAPHIDAAFDRGLVTFDAAGRMIISNSAPSRDMVRLGIKSGVRLRLNAKHQRYMEFHRSRIFVSLRTLT
jgi:putative restriction endonuclease